MVFIKNSSLESNFLHRGIQILFLFLMFFVLSCSTAKKLRKSNISAYQHLVQNSVVFNQGFTGFKLYDPATEKVIFEQNADKYFTPASNTKIFTFYTALHVLGDSIPAFRYLIKNDSLIFWGTGDPSFISPYFSENERVIAFLKNRKEKLFFCGHNFQDERFGSGWTWDDYNYSFQPEKSSFPFHGNVVQFEKKKMADTFDIKPASFKDKLDKSEKLKLFQVKRVFEQNTFEYNPQLLTILKYKKEHPFKYSDNLLVDLLTEILEKKVTLLEADAMPPSTAKTVYGVLADTLYRRLLQESDNFVAEQLLLLCSDVLFDTLNTLKTIQFARDSLLKDLPDQANWVDGSGLSRYNLFTPRSIVYLLADLYKKIPRDRLFAIFPAGGESGTILKYYAGEEKPYVFAKTGTLRNNHCLSGYLVAKSGKVLIFSFMHNNFPNGSAAHKAEMERVLNAVYRAY